MWRNHYIFSHQILWIVTNHFVQSLSFYHQHNFFFIIKYGLYHILSFYYLFGIDLQLYHYKIYLFYKLAIVYVQDMASSYLYFMCLSWCNNSIWYYISFEHFGPLPVEGLINLLQAIPFFKRRLFFWYSADETSRQD